MKLVVVTRVVVCTSSWNEESVGTYLLLQTTFFSIISATPLPLVRAMVTQIRNNHHIIMVKDLDTFIIRYALKVVKEQTTI